MAVNYSYNISGLTNKSEDFDNVLTVSRKFNFTFAYFFHTICPTRSNWQMILSQTKNFNIFLVSLQISSVIKILSSYCYRYTYKYIPHRDLWLNRLCFEISNSSEKKNSLTIDIKQINNLGPSKFRNGAENDKEQICYFNYNKNDRTVNRYLAVRKQISRSEIFFFYC